MEDFSFATRESDFEFDGMEIKTVRGVGYKLDIGDGNV